MHYWFGLKFSNPDLVKVAIEIGRNESPFMNINLAKILANSAIPRESVPRFA